jgi:hypothetical protein
MWPDSGFIWADGLIAMESEAHDLYGMSVFGECGVWVTWFCQFVMPECAVQ